MPYSLLLEQQQKQTQNIKQMQRLMMSRQMQQAIHLLQAPVVELATLVDVELEQNPVLEISEEVEDVELQEESDDEESADQDNEAKEIEFSDKDFEILRRLDEDFRDYLSDANAPPVRRTQDQDKLQTYLENSIVAKESLYEHLMDQAREMFSTDAELKIAEAIIGSFDESGFLATSPQEVAILTGCKEKEIEKVLAIVQTFDPTGVGAKDLREALLIQLQARGKAESLAYQIIEKHFDDLLKNHIPAIKKGLHKTAEEVREAIDTDIVSLDLHPASQISRQTVGYIQPDLRIQQEEEKLIVILSDESIPSLRINKKYLRMLDDENLTAETKEFIKQKMGSAKWFLHNIFQRNETIERIGNILAEEQKKFFIEPDGQLHPLTMQAVADKLEIHESTVARAVANKYVDTPKGIFPLRAFFTNALETETGDSVSSKTVHDMLLDMIKKENKAAPLSDDAIAAIFKEKGIHCARRTVAKYRNALGIGNTRQRRKF